MPLGTPILPDVNFLEVSHLVPLNFVDKNRYLPNNYNFKHFDGWFAEEQKIEFEQGQCYYQKWQQDDIIPLQIKANYDPIYWRVRDNTGAIVDSDLMTNVITLFGTSYFESSIALNSFPEGFYKVEIVAGDPVQTTLESETIEIREQWENTLLFKYRNNFNNNILWQTGIYFNLRVDGVIAEFTPISTRTVYIDQPGSAKTVYGTAARTFNLFVGNQMGMPNWIADKLEEIFDQNSVDIDGKAFSAIEGAKLTPKRIERYAWVQWSMEIREALNRRSKRFESTGITEEKITQDYFVSLKLFGPISGSAQDTSAIITKVE